MPTKVDELFADLGLNFGGAVRDAQALDAAAGKLGRTSGVAADAQNRLERASRRAGDQARNTRGRFVAQDKSVQALTRSAKRLLATYLGFEAARRVLTGLVRVFFGFRQEMNNVRAITNATDAEFARLRATALDLGRTTQFTARDAAAAMTFLARTGLDVNQTIGVIPGTLNLAAAAAVDLATAADISTNIMKGLGLEVRDLAGLVDVLAATTNSSNVNLFELGEAMKIVAPVAASAGADHRELAAAIGALGDAGIKGTLAGTALRRALINLTTGAEGADAVIDRLGLRVTDANGRFVGFASIVDQLTARGASARDMFELFGARGVAALLALQRRGGDSLRAFTRELEMAEGTAERMREQQMEGLVGAGKRLKSQIEATAIAWGSAFEPALSVAADALRVVFQWLEAVLFVLQSVGIAGVTAARLLAQSFKLAVGGLATAIGFLVERVGDLLVKLAGLALELPGVSALAEDFAVAAVALEAEGRRAKEQGLDLLGEGVADLDRIMQEGRDTFSDLVDDVLGLGEASEDAAGSLGQLSDDLDDLLTSAAGRGVQLDLATFERQLAQVRAQLRQAAGLGGEGPLTLDEQLRTQERIAGANERTAEQVQALVDAEAELAAVLEDVARLQREIAEAGEDQTQVAQLTAELTDRVRDLAKASREVDRALRGVADGAKSLEGQVKRLGGKPARARDEGLAGLAGDAVIALRAVNRVGDALGFLDQDLRRAVDSAIDLFQAVEKLSAAKAFNLAAGAGIVGAGIGLVSGLVGGLFGESETARAMRENTLALERLRREVDVLAESLRDVTGADVARARALLEDAFANLEFRPLGGAFARFTAEEFDFLQRFADQLGLELTKPLVGQLVQLQEAIAALDLSALTETFAGAAQLLATRLALFDVEDPLEELQLTLDTLAGFAPAIADATRGLDVTTEAGRAALERALRELFQQIATGQLDVSQLGALTVDEMLALLGDIEGLLDEIETNTAEAAAEDAGTADSFVRSTQITEIQGHQLLAIQGTIAELNRRQLTALEQIRGALAAPIRPPATLPLDRPGDGAALPVTIGRLEVTVPLTVSTPVTDPAQLAADLAPHLLERIDAGLDELRFQRARARGE